MICGPVDLCTPRILGEIGREREDCDRVRRVEDTVKSIVKGSRNEKQPPANGHFAHYNEKDTCAFTLPQWKFDLIFSLSLLCSFSLSPTSVHYRSNDIKVKWSVNRARLQLPLVPLWTWRRCASLLNLPWVIVTQSTDLSCNWIFVKRWPESRMGGVRGQLLSSCASEEKRKKNWSTRTRETHPARTFNFWLLLFLPGHTRSICCCSYCCEMDGLQAQQDQGIP